MTIDILPHITGDTWDGISLITFSENNSAIDLTDAFIEMKVKYSIASPDVLYLNSLPGSGINILNAIEGTAFIPSRIINIPVGKYSWYINLTLNYSGWKKTLFNGIWDIRPNIPDVTVYERRNYN